MVLHLTRDKVRKENMVHPEPDMVETADKESLRLLLVLHTGTLDGLVIRDHVEENQCFHSMLIQKEAEDSACMQVIRWSLMASFHPKVGLVHER